MLEISLDDPKKEKFNKNLIIVVDGHSHLGKEAIITTKGKNIRQNTILDTIDMYQKVGNEIKNYRANETPFKITTRSFYNTFQTFTGEISPFEKCLRNGEVIDAIVVFPFSDILKDKTIPAFQQTNDFLLSRCYSIENSIRTFPYCRVDPKDGNLACNEVIRAVNSGAQGLKLHPLSQHFVDKINSIEVEEILSTAAKLNLPVIFDVANTNIAEDIVTVSSKVYNTLKYDDTEKQLKIILGHFAFDYTSKKMAEFLKLPYIYGETSGCRGEDVRLLFNNLIDTFEDNSWSKKLIFGSDANYFGWLQILDFWKYLLSNKWWDKLVDNEYSEIVEIIRRILGKNTINLLRPLSIKQTSRLNISKGIPKFLQKKKHNVVKTKLFDKIYKETSFVPLIDVIEYNYLNDKIIDSQTGEIFQLENMIPRITLGFVSSHQIKKERKFVKSNFKINFAFFNGEYIWDLIKKDLTKKEITKYFNQVKINKEEEDIK